MRHRVFSAHFSILKVNFSTKNYFRLSPRKNIVPKFSWFLLNSKRWVFTLKVLLTFAEGLVEYCFHRDTSLHCIRFLPRMCFSFGSASCEAGIGLSFLGERKSDLSLRWAPWVFNRRRTPKSCSETHREPNNHILLDAKHMSHHRFYDSAFSS
jgi:hypothetical protein